MTGAAATGIAQSLGRIVVDYIVEHRARGHRRELALHFIGATSC